jgi:hypothetical protein
VTDQQKPGYRQGSKVTHKKQRQRLRRRLQQQGWNDTEVRRRLADTAMEQEANRRAAHGSAAEREATEAVLYPDDRKYRVTVWVNNVGRGKRSR